MEYHYTASGLDNVILLGLRTAFDDDGDECVSIPNINGLHKTIAEAMVNRPCGISGKELRFLRTSMSMTQAQLATAVHKDGQSIGRWERGEVPLDANAEALIRLMAREKLGLRLSAPVDRVTGWCQQGEGEQWIRIDASDPENYRQLAPSVWRETFTN